MAILRDPCLIQPPEKLPPAADGNKYRDSQPDIMKQRETLEHSALNEMSPSNPSPQGSGNPVEEEVARV